MEKGSLSLWLDGPVDGWAQSVRRKPVLKVVKWTFWAFQGQLLTSISVCTDECIHIHLYIIDTHTYKHIIFVSNLLLVNYVEGIFQVLIIIWACVYIGIYVYECAYVTIFWKCSSCPAVRSMLYKWKEYIHMCRYLLSIMCYVPRLLLFYVMGKKQWLWNLHSQHKA